MDVEIKVLNAHALEPGKVYVFEAAYGDISGVQLREVFEYLGKQGIKGVLVRSTTGAALAVRGPEEPAHVD